MTYFLGNVGNVRLRRNNAVTLSAVVKNADIVTTLNRVGVEGATDNLLTGDRVTISTTDSRGLVFLPTANWTDGEGVSHASFNAFIHVNAAGGLRFFPSFQAAVNNVRSQEYTIQTFSVDPSTPLPVQIEVRDLSGNVLGDVTSYTFNTDREGLDITTLSDKFKRMYSAGLISGSGSIDCLFNNTTSGVKETPLLMLQLINRVDIGSEFDLLLSITSSDNDPSAADIFYEFSAMVTRSGLEVTATDIISCSIDFVTTGEIKLLVGRPSGYVLKEDDDRIALNQNSLAFLLAEVED
jgi:hypothetical protein